MTLDQSRDAHVWEVNPNSTFVLCSSILIEKRQHEVSGAFWKTEIGGHWHDTC